ncbi:MAG: hypothetical protein ACI398_04075 [Clostridium sp.]
MTVSTKAKATLKLYNQVASYLFEQQYGELEKYGTQSDINNIKKVQEVLAKIINKGK